MNKVIYISILSLSLFSGCMDSNKLHVDSDNYTIYVSEAPIDKEKYHIFGPLITDIKVRINMFPLIPVTATYIRSYNLRNFTFKGDSLEIVFMRPYNKDSSNIPEFCHIACKNINGKSKAFTIFWKNKFNLENMPNTQEIGETTDTLLSTLSYNIIKKLYPDFKGFYKKIKIDTILLDPNYEEVGLGVYEDNYYNHIQFKGLTIEQTSLNKQK